MHEIITLQLGERSNYLATHFWNIQESYFTYSENEESPVDHNVHFRPGIGADGTETFTPRTVIYDLKGGFGNLRKYNALYEIEERSLMPQGMWDGNAVIQQQPPIPQTEYQKSLDLGLPPPRLTSDAVRYWSDFNRVFYHPKSVVQLSAYELHSQVMPFEDWAVGEELFNSMDREHDILDRDLRSFAEESDQLKAIQIFCGTDDAWGGFGAGYMDRLNDEYGKKDLWVWALEGGMRTQRSQRILATTNSARSICAMSPQASAYIPILDPPRQLPGFLTGDLGKRWYSSALLSMAVESITLPTRLRGHRAISSWLAEGEGSRKLFNLQCAIGVDGAGVADATSKPAQVALTGEYQEEDESDQTLLDGFDLDFSPFGPAKFRENDNVFSQALVTRDSKTLSGEGLDVTTDARQRQRISEFAPSVQRFHSSLEYPVLDSFPSDLISGQTQVGTTMAVRAALSTTRKIGDQVKELGRFVARAVPALERENLVNGLAEVEEAYRNRWESGSDTGEDD